MADRMHASPMRRVWTIAFREFRHTVITKGFIFGAVVMPVVMFAAFAALGLLIGMQMTPVVGTLVVIDESGTVAAFAAEELTPGASGQRYARVAAAKLGTQELARQ